MWYDAGKGRVRCGDCRRLAKEAPAPNCRNYQHEEKFQEFRLRREEEEDRLLTVEASNLSEEEYTQLVERLSPNRHQSHRGHAS